MKHFTYNSWTLYISVIVKYSLSSPFLGSKENIMAINDDKYFPNTYTLFQEYFKKIIVRKKCLKCTRDILSKMQKQKLRSVTFQFTYFVILNEINIILHTFENKNKKVIVSWRTFPNYIPNVFIEILVF